MRKCYLLLVGLLTACADTVEPLPDIRPQPFSSSISAVRDPDDGVILNIMGRFLNGRDHVTTTEPNEWRREGLEGGMFYIAHFPQAGTRPMYRLWDGQTDHMDSSDPLEGRPRWRNQGELGHPWEEPRSGACRLRRLYSAAWPDHLTASCNEVAQGFVDDGHPLGYGYPRGRPVFDDDANEIALTGESGIRLTANRMAGGAVTELWWGNKQFVNNFDLGRQIQSAVFLPSTNGTRDDSAPTEAGDRHGFGPMGNRSQAVWAHGSILERESHNATTLSTTTIPLFWDPLYRGGGAANPVMWKGRISKTLALDDPLPGVVSWTSTVTAPPANRGLEVEILFLGAYLTSDFDQFLVYEFEANGAFASQHDLTDAVMRHGDQIDSTNPGAGRCLTPKSEQGMYASLLRPRSGGAILSTRSGRHALGVYVRDLASKNLFVKLCDPSKAATDDPTSAETNKWGLAGYRKLGEPAISETMYLVVGTLEEVKSKMWVLQRSSDVR